MLSSQGSMKMNETCPVLPQLFGKYYSSPFLRQDRLTQKGSDFPRPESELIIIKVGTMICQHS